MCRNPAGHTWPRRGADSRLSSSRGYREIWTCNDCLATKVVICIGMADGVGEDIRVAVVEEPLPTPVKVTSDLG